MTSPDIRAGVALLIAALSAEGKSTIHNIEQIDRGEDHDPNDIDEVPVKAHRLDVDRVGLVELDGSTRLREAVKNDQAADETDEREEMSRCPSADRNVVLQRVHEAEDRIHR